MDRHRKMPTGSGRDLFSSHGVGAGKGDKARHKFDETWRSNYEAIDFHHEIFSGFRREGNKLVKSYGAAAQPKKLSMFDVTCFEANKSADNYVQLGEE